MAGAVIVAVCVAILVVLQVALCAPTAKDSRPNAAAAVLGPRQPEGTLAHCPGVGVALSGRGDHTHARTAGVAWVLRRCGELWCGAAVARTLIITTSRGRMGAAGCCSSAPLTTRLRAKAPCWYTTRGEGGLRGE